MIGNVDLYRGNRMEYEYNGIVYSVRVEALTRYDGEWAITISTIYGRFKVGSGSTFEEALEEAHRDEGV